MGNAAGVKIKTARQLERHFKGVANHHRIEIVRLLAEEGGLNLDEIARRLGGNFKTIGEHTRKLVQSGLVNKRHNGKSVIHTLSPYGRTFNRFIAAFSKQGAEP